jgi:hypothetical protein
MQSVSAVKCVMVTVAKAKVVSYVMPATGTTNDVMDLQPAATIRLGPPAHGAAAMLGYPFKQGGAFRGVQRRPPLLGEGQVEISLPTERALLC